MYHTLHTRPLKPQVTNIKNIRQKIKKVLMDCFETKAFSTFPYIHDGYTSKQAIAKTNSGNCIALSLYIKDQLHKRYGIRSHLVPATVPSHIHKEGYLDICHVSLMIPAHPNGGTSSYYLIDPAFYFMEPILIHRKSTSLQPVRSVNIYGNTLDIVHPTLETSEERIQLNQYQAMPKGTQCCTCYHNDKTDDTWKYYLREILHPDQAISSFFIAIYKDPFFVSTIVEEGLCKKDIIIRTHEGGRISIKQGVHTLYDGQTTDIPNDMVQDIRHTLQTRGFDEQILTL